LLGQAEKEESFIKIGDCANILPIQKDHFNLTVNDNIGPNSLYVNEPKLPIQRKSSDLSDEERDQINDSLARVIAEENLKGKFSSEQRKISMGASDSCDSYTKFETPRTSSRFFNTKNN
jgi:hypothetical protein